LRLGAEYLQNDLQLPRYAKEERFDITIVLTVSPWAPIKQDLSSLGPKETKTDKCIRHFWPTNQLQTKFISECGVAKNAKSGEACAKAAPQGLEFHIIILQPCNPSGISQSGAWK
jgi:hypothetical protein